MGLGTRLKIGINGLLPRSRPLNETGRSTYDNGPDENLKRCEFTTTE